ncbi:MAG: hypothetical protein H3C64_07465 [Candidatus Kuenenia stuttgartiensis]|jgi:hypothetical protein|uniref:Uncharacterized protein n=1 Tax=Kuenenia stuttgartiensis TaxID=174633 RepID=A0A2C9CFV7_KUEST|nr:MULTISPECIES: hypothetical protein [Kuenenia]MBE7546164.1 hypothetical protein [Planctomycetia bacterium]MBW7942231.1 hypothetical protein [Candidatus Kuenenia stuttgartiensis]MBZ0193038.1 hypothetical protein [Candidatus Kuenenia stuttgartiensis]MCL4726592.1 hypothetical protein [Candidatus Kuenenia stuttgartiensis]MCZ7621473.1 hypothetical protein [Candidatus Kuenenia sp.]
MKITMLGYSGSGKTTLMHGMASTLAPGNADHDYALIPRLKNDDELASFNEEVDVLVDFMENTVEHAGYWPLGTNKTTVYPFAIEYLTNHKITNIEWVDFRGGLLSHIFKPAHRDEKELEALFFHLIESNVVVIVADAYHLTHFTRIDEIRHFSGAKIINLIMNRFDRIYPNRKLNILIVLTKADSVDSCWKEEDYKQLLDKGMEVFDPVVKLCRNNSNWNGGILPVSVIGEENVERKITPKTDSDSPMDIPFLAEDKIIGLPQPFNTEYVLYFCLGFSLLQMKNAAKESISDYQKTIEQVLQDAGTLNSIWSFLRGRPSAAEIARKSSEKKKRDEESLLKFESHIDTLMDYTRKRVRLFA